LISGELMQLSGREHMLTEKVYSMIKSDVSYPQDKIIQYVKAKEMICDYISRSKSITNKKVQELCGYSRNRAHYTLKKLCDESVLKLVGKGSGAKYVLAE
jgi:ATP-dependent DNA helicase RecG